ncbi:flavin reductase family protein [Candidatus Woesearchaeota archaeon]|nr:flavin reductase family protein [Candidatus Woesearchaeota archaeon]
MKVSDVANPRQTVLVTSRDEIESRFSPEKKTKDNIFTLSWHTQVSHEPELYAISSGKERFSTKLIRKSKVFVVNFMPLKLKKEVLFCGTHSGEHIDKFEETGLEKEEADKVDCARIKQACGYLECKVVNEIEAGDHIIFIGEVINSKLNNKEKRIFQKKGEDFTTTR